jgi:hypothetical protein
MRARLMLKLVSVVVMLVVTVMGARSCSTGSGRSSPLDPANVARNGIAGLCANQQAAAAAAGDGSQSSLDLSQAGDDPAGLKALTQALGGSASCPTTTVSQAGTGG